MDFCVPVFLSRFFVSVSVSVSRSVSLPPSLLFLWVTGLEDYLQQKYVYIFPSVSRFKLLAVLHKQPHLDIRRIYGFCWSGESTISQSLAFSFFMPRLTTGGDCLSRFHAYYKTKSIFLFLTTRLKAHNLSNSVYAHYVFSITRLSNKPIFDIPCLFQLNILILVRVMKEMTTLVQPMGEDSHIKQIRLDLKFAVSEIF